MATIGELTNKSISPIDGVIRRGDIAEFMSDKHTDKGPCSGPIIRAENGEIVVRLSDSSGEKFEVNKLKIIKETRHRDGMSKLWVFD